MNPPPVLRPGQIETAAGGIAELRVPPATVFSSRSRRLRHLAEGHSLGAYLRFIAAVAERQHDALDHHPAIPIPDADLLAICRDQAMPPLAPDVWPRHPHWQDVCRGIAEAIYDETPAGGRKALALILNPEKAWLEAQAGTLLAQKSTGLNLATAPVIAAALQVQWTYLARQLQSQQTARRVESALCPVCGSQPTASVIRTNGPARGLRYLHCGLCGSEWHMVRSKCSQCGNSRGISYYSIEDGRGIVSAEACPACRSYLKVIHQDRDSLIDPLADDLATLALDLLMGSKDLARSGINLLIQFGSHPQDLL